MPKKKATAEKAKPEKAKPESATYYQIKIVLCDAPLPIWRRLYIHAQTPLSLVHEIIQLAMGWSNYHLYHFEIDGKRYGEVQGAPGEKGVLDSNEYNLQDLLKKPDDRMIYMYDFGDDWEHEVTLEKMGELVNPAFLARCITGKRACPPEDVGGVGGYFEFINIIEDPDNEQQLERLEWVGCDFDPNSFDARLVNLRLELFEQSLQPVSGEMAGARR